MLQTVSALALDTLNSLLQLDSVLLTVSLELLCLHGVIVVAVVRWHSSIINTSPSSSRTRCQISNTTFYQKQIMRLAVADDDILTIARCVAILACQACGARNALANTVAHVAARSGPETVDHEAGAVPHPYVQFSDATFSVLIDAGCA